MLRPTNQGALLACTLLLGACASRPLPKYEKPIARTRIQSVRTTAYTHTESDHRQHGRRTALGTQLQCGSTNSAAADWSRWPAGTVFRIHETGELFEVDDYGWALSGTNTIDLYKSSRGAMNSWGVRRVTIENLRWGDVDRSLAILRGRSKYKHVRRMISQIESRYAELKRPVETGEVMVASVELAPAPTRAAEPVSIRTEPFVRPAQPIATRATTNTRVVSGRVGVEVSSGTTARNPALVPFRSAPISRN
jgi:3D (Asp-Asp-Asp) domain-containing protein